MAGRPKVEKPNKNQSVSFTHEHLEYIKSKGSVSKVINNLIQKEIDLDNNTELDEYKQSLKDEIIKLIDGEEDGKI